MNSKELTTEYRMEQWTQIMQERAATGENIKEYCENRGIPRARYFYWQKKLRERACTELITSSKSPKPVPSGWAICEEDATLKTSKDEIRIEIGKCRVKAESGTNINLLENVCRMLVRMC